MKPMEHYKAAVMQRAEEKRIARKRAVRRTLAVCLPLCLCLSIVSVTVLPRLSPVGEDHAPELNDGALTEYPDATVFQGNTVVAVIDDADAVYDAVLALYTTHITSADNSSLNTENGSDNETCYGNGGLAESAAEDGCDNESYFEDGESAGSTAPYYLCFYREDGLHEFRLANHLLTDLISGDSVYLTEEQATALMNGETP